MRPCVPPADWKMDLVHQFKLTGLHREARATRQLHSTTASELRSERQHDARFRKQHAVAGLAGNRSGAVVTRPVPLSAGAADRLPGVRPTRVRPDASKA